MKLVFGKQSKEGSIYLLTTREMAEEQRHNPNRAATADKDRYSNQLVENIEILYKDSKMDSPKNLQHHAVAWYNHYL